MSELHKEYRKRKKSRNETCVNSSYHTVVKGCTDSLDSDELDLYRFMIGGMQAK